ncbi:MAG: hypothetical protein WBF15_01930 [Candidatus Sulfotelmatobacter sp.]
MKLRVEAVAPLRCVDRFVLFSCFLFLFVVPSPAQTAISELKTMTLEELQEMAFLFVFMHRSLPLLLL